MTQTIGVVKEHLLEETRVALIPEAVAKFISLGFKVVIQQGAGEKAGFADHLYQNVGAEIGTLEWVIEQSKYIFTVNEMSPDGLRLINSQHTLIGNYGARVNQELVTKIAAKGAQLMSLELMPRISRAQVADILSSQNNLAGYYSVLKATQYFPKVVPLMMTSAGMIAPAKVFVMGVGVAGLQAIATAKRLGAVVSGYDVRLATKEQVESLGAKFFVVDENALGSAETEGGYAKEMSAEYQQKAKQALHDYVASQDIIITTALIPGKKAPIMIDEQMVKAMKPGSVIVDLAASGGGNCSLTKAGEVVKYHGVTIVGDSFLACQMAHTASYLYGNNILNLFKLFVQKDKTFAFDYEDEIIKNILVTKDGKVLLSL